MQGILLLQNVHYTWYKHIKLFYRVNYYIFHKSIRKEDQRNVSHLNSYCNGEIASDKVGFYAIADDRYGSQSLIFSYVKLTIETSGVFLIRQGSIP